MNLGELAVAQGSLVLGLGGAGVELDVNVKDLGDGGLGGAKGADNEASFEGRLRKEKLDGEFALVLCDVLVSIRGLAG